MRHGKKLLADFNGQMPSLAEYLEYTYRAIKYDALKPRSIAHRFGYISYLYPLYHHLPRFAGAALPSARVTTQEDRIVAVSAIPYAGLRCALAIVFSGVNHSYSYVIKTTKRKDYDVATGVLHGKYRLPWWAKKFVDEVYGIGYASGMGEEELLCRTESEESVRSMVNRSKRWLTTVNRRLNRNIKMEGQFLNHIPGAEVGTPIVYGDLV